MVADVNACLSCGDGLFDEEGVLCHVCARLIATLPPLDPSRGIATWVLGMTWQQHQALHTMLAAADCETADAYFATRPWAILAFARYPLDASA